MYGFDSPNPLLLILEIIIIDVKMMQIKDEIASPDNVSLAMTILSLDRNHHPTIRQNQELNSLFTLY